MHKLYKERKIYVISFSNRYTACIFHKLFIHLILIKCMDISMNLIKIKSIKLSYFFLINI